MSAIWELPTSLEVGGINYAIRTDFRDVLYLLDVLSDPDYEEDEKGAVYVLTLYEDGGSIPASLWPEAMEKAGWFIDGGMAEKDNRRPRPRTMDWNQDASIILPAVNKVLGREVRAMEYLHWWTFLGAYMEIGESLFSTVVGIRQKRAKGKNLEKYEKEFYAEHRDLINLHRRETQQEREQREELKKLFV